MKNPMVSPMIVVALAMTSIFAACATTPSRDTAPGLPSPWSEPPLNSAAVPPIYLERWRAAENATRCALLAPERLDPALQQAATPRAATFSGGWGVAYDLPQTRSAFGVAGSGASAWSPAVYDAWPH